MAEARDSDPAFNVTEKCLLAWGSGELLDQGKTSEAIEVFKLAVAMFPNSSSGYANLGETYYRAGNKAKPSRPGVFHPEPLTDPDVNFSIHPARATQRRLPPSIKTRSSSGYPLSPSQCGWPAPFAPRELPRFLTTTEQSALIGASVFSASWWYPFAPFSLAITDPVLKFRTKA